MKYTCDNHNEELWCPGCMIDPGDKPCPSCGENENVALLCNECEGSYEDED